MIIKILQNQTSFAGIDYSERKNAKGISELLAAENFGLVSEDMTKQSYIKYLTMIGDLNDRVKNKQFHAVISTKGEKHSFEELTDIAKKYMIEMGYANNPYLVYGHKDTDHNHVHIVSSRVDKQGLRIDPSFERIRTRDFIKNELELNLDKSVDQVVAQTMGYNFGTKAQIKLLIEKEQFITRDKKGGIDLIKDGKVQKHISKEILDKNLSKYELENSSLNQHKAIFKKYSEGRNLDEFQSIMKEKFGMDIVFHYPKKSDDLSKHENPYGYSIIDHKSKTVMKGSQIMPLKDLLSGKEKPLHKEAIYDIIGKRIEGESFSNLQSRLGRYGYELKPNGSIHDSKNGIKITKLDDHFLNRTKYDDRKNMAQVFTLTNNTNKSALSQLFFIKAKDVHGPNRELTTKEKNKYKDLLAIAVNVGPIEERLKSEGIQIVQLGKSSYLIDHDEKLVMNTEKDLGMSVDEDRIKIALPENSAETLELNKDYKPTPANDFIGNIGAIVDEGADEAKKRKRISRFR